MAKIKKADPMKTKTGKPRLAGRNLAQLEALLKATSKKKEQAKIQRVIDSLPKTVV